MASRFAPLIGLGIGVASVLSGYLLVLLLLWISRWRTRQWEAFQADTATAVWASGLTGPERRIAGRRLTDRLRRLEDQERFERTVRDYVRVQGTLLFPVEEPFVSRED